MKKLLLSLVLVVFLMGCGGSVNDNTNYWKEIYTNNGQLFRHYQIIYVESMPCLVLDATNTSITCDWSKWDGNK